MIVDIVLNSISKTFAKMSGNFIWSGKRSPMTARTLKFELKLRQIFVLMFIVHTQGVAL